MSKIKKHFTQPPGSPTEQHEMAGHIKKLVERQETLGQALTEIGGQSAFLRQQNGQVYAAVEQLYQAVSHQCQQLLQSDAALTRELRSFQTGGPQRAMLSVFVKFFRDLIRHLNHLDDMVSNMSANTAGPEVGWQESIRVARDGFEAVLKDWGCCPIQVDEGKEAFSPERHQATPAEAGEVPPSMPTGVIVKVRRRGWQLQDQIIQYPLVVVS